MSIIKTVSQLVQKIKLLIINDQKEELLKFIHEIENSFEETDLSHSIYNKVYKNEFFYSLLFQYSKEPILIIKDYQINNCNLSALKLFQFDTKEEFLRMQIPLFVSSECTENSNQKSKQIIDEIISNGYLKFEWEIDTKDQKKCPYEVSATLIPLKNETIIYAILMDISEKKAVYKALQESEAKFKLIADSSFDWEIFRSVDGKLLYVSPGFDRITGFSAEDYLQGKINLKDIVHPDDLQKVLAVNRYILDGNQVENFEFRVIDKSKKVIHVSANARAAFDSNRNVTGMRSSIRDITQKVKILKENRMFSAAIEQSPISIVITDTQGNIEYANPQFTKATGYLLKDTIGQNVRILNSGLVPHEVFSQLWKHIKAGITWNGEFINKKRNGELFYESAIIAPILDNLGNAINYIALKTDITEKKLSEKELILKEQQLRQIIDTAPQLIFAKDIHGKFILINKAMADVYGCSPNDLIGKTDSDFINDTKLVEKYKQGDLYVIQTGKQIYNPEEIMLHKDGSVHYYQTTKIPFTVSGTSEPAILGVAVDITERKNMQLALMESESRFKLIVDYSYAWEIFVDSSGKLVYISPSFERITGYKVEEYINGQVTLKDLIFEDDYPSVIKKLHLSLQGESVENFEFRMFHKNKNLMYASADIQTVKNSEGRIIGSRSSIRDSTRRFVAEQNNKNLSDELLSKLNEEKYLRKELISKKKIIDSELEKAKRIQQMLLPTEIPENVGLKFHSRYIPMSQVGGDFYDICVFETKQTAKCGILIADVSGHGIPSAFIASIAKIVWTYNVNDELSPAEVFRRINNDLLKIMNGNYLTAFMGFFDLNPYHEEENSTDHRGLFHYSTGGHLAPYIIRKNSYSFTPKASGQVIGIFPEPRVHDYSIPYYTGDRFIFFTDGLYEATNFQTGELLGIDRMYDIFEEGRTLSGENLCNFIIEKIQKFCQSSSYHDDITFLVVDVV